MRYKGLPINEGIVIGRIKRVSAESRPGGETGAAEADSERMRFLDALLEYEGSMKRLALKASTEEASDILNAQLMIARDPQLSDEIFDLIDAGMYVEEAVCEALRKYEDEFLSSDNETFKARAEDISEVRNGILSSIGNCDNPDSITEGAGEDEDKNDKAVIYADNLSIAGIIELKSQNIGAVVMRCGTYASHAAVVLRSMEIPAVFGVDLSDVTDDTECIVDGASGYVITYPTGEEKENYQKKIKSSSGNGKAFGISNEPCKTADGVRIRLSCNIGSEFVPEIATRSDGAGLVRTEFIFLNEGIIPSEEKQTEVYSHIADCFDGKEIVIRTLDTGGDKNISSEDDLGEENPALGIRGIRYSLKDTKVFTRQLRAILRASQGRNISIMVPMITSVYEMIQVRELIDAEKANLRSKGFTVSEDIKLGCMIETPAAVLCADDLAGVSDFFSIGTNDLSQYIMCADRADSEMSAMCSIYQPAVLRAIKMICESARKADIPVTICGEAASDVKVLPVLLGLGIRSLSVDPSRLVSVREAVKELKMDECEKIAAEVPSKNSMDTIMRILR